MTFNRNHFISSVFNISSENDFSRISKEIFHYQYYNNSVYKRFVDYLETDINKINHYTEIPFLPVELYKTHMVISGDEDYERVFYSSGTTSENRSRLYVKDSSVYEQSFIKGFQLFFGKPNDYHILALLPGYSEESSLVYMVSRLIKLSNSQFSGFYLNNNNGLAEVLQTLNDRRIILFGVTHALLNFINDKNFYLPDLIVVETGGMKGRGKEMVREQVHAVLKKGFSIKSVGSEYGMTELFSQAYSSADGLFKCPPWMKIIARDINDPMSILPNNQTGGINIIDLANIDTCSFIATSDLGKTFDKGTFEISGRFDYSDIRGCNLMI